jgi:FkbM family methyltransferase
MLSLNQLRKAARQYANVWRVRRVYGTTRPDSVILPQSGGRLYIDPQDSRAWKVLVVGSARKFVRRNQRFWQNATQLPSLGLAVDVGVNYGECLLGHSYPTGLKLHGFEANPFLVPYLEKTLGEHPSRSQIQLHQGLVSDQPGPPGDFFVNRLWSGTSSALRPAAADQAEVVKVPTVSVDSTLAGSSNGDRPGGLVFKVDVEGYELRVLAGMRETLNRTAWSVGLIEFDVNNLRRAGESVEMGLSLLATQFRIFAFSSNTRVQRVEGFHDLARAFNKSSFHTDLLLVSRTAPDEVNRAVDSWGYGTAIAERAGARRAAA